MGTIFKTMEISFEGLEGKISHHEKHPKQHHLEVSLLGPEHCRCRQTEAALSQMVDSKPPPLG